MKNLTRAAMVAAGLLAFSAAQAATVTFDFTGARSFGSSVTVTGSDSVTTVDASAANTGSDPSWISRSSYGLLVCIGAAAPATDCGTAYGDQHWTDSSGPDETITLDFGSKTVTLLSATFYPNFAGRFDLGVDGSPVLDEAFLANVVNFGSGYAGSQFSFGADTTFARNDRFKLSSITVEIPNEVPVPGTLGLLGLGLMGLGIARRGK